MTTSEFANYDLIIIGDSVSWSGPTAAGLLAAYDTRNTWAAAVTGRIVVSGLDSGFHASQWHHPGAATFLTTTLDWLTKGPLGNTALYVTSDWGRRNLDFLSPFGAFGSSEAQDDVTITSPSHQIMFGSTSDSLSYWEVSAHSYLTYPASFSSLAIGADFNTLTGSVVVARSASPSLQPLLQGKCDTSGTAVGVAVSGNYAYVADWDAGLHVIDVSNPARPMRVGGYDTSGIAEGVASLAASQVGS